MFEKLTEEEVRQETRLPDIDATLEDFGFTLEEALQNQTNLHCGGGTPQNKREETRAHRPVPYCEMLDLHCLICGNVVSLKSIDDSYSVSKELPLKKVD